MIVYFQPSLMKLDRLIFAATPEQVPKARERLKRLTWFE